MHRDDMRLGHPVPTGPVLDHLCPLCEGEGDAQPHCYCNGLGVVSAEQAQRFASDDPDPRWRARPLAPVPAFTGRCCSDCAFRPGSPERERFVSASALFRHLEHGNDEASFYCHAGMHDGAKGYVPRQRDLRGAPIGHPICAGWLAHYKRSLIRESKTDGQ